MMNTVLFQFDFSNPTHLQVFGELCSKGIPFQMVGVANNNIGTDVGTSANNTVSDVKTTKQYRDVQKHVDNMGYEVKVQVDKATGKKYHCISYVAPKGVHMSADLKSQINKGIKALANITEIKVASKKTNKKTGETYDSEFKAWGYATKKTAEEKIPTLATSFDYIEKEQIK